MRIARLALTGIVAGGVGAWVGANILAGATYAHTLTHPGCIGMGATPADVGIMNTQDITYPSHDGLTLRAWYLPPESGVVIILLPGYGGARDGMLREAAILSRYGYGLLMTELRSCANPEGETTLGYKEAADLTEAVTWARSQPGVAHIGLLGYSLGGITAILGAADDPRVEAVVAEGGFYDLAADITNEGGDNSPGDWLIYQSVLFFFRRETDIHPRDISPISVIHRISPRPLLLIYGDREEAAHPQEQWERAGEPKFLWIVPNCNHGEYLSVAPEEWERRVTAFFALSFPDQ